MSSEPPIINITGDRVALGPLRRDLLPLYQRWINDFSTLRTLGLPPTAMTLEQETAWYDAQATSERSVTFTVYERATDRPIGSTGLHEIDYRNRKATFGIMIGEADCRGKGYGTETTRMMGGRLWDEVYMDCLATDFTSTVLGRIFVPDQPGS